MSSSNPAASSRSYTLSLHDALPILDAIMKFMASAVLPGNGHQRAPAGALPEGEAAGMSPGPPAEDRKSTRLNSSHLGISYAVFCLKKKSNSRMLAPTLAPL